MFSFPRCLAAWSYPVRLAVSTLQLPELEPAPRLLQGRLPHVQRRPTRDVQEGGAETQRGHDWTVWAGTGDRSH